MRFIYFLLITFIFSACGHQKIRFSKVKRTQKVVEVSEIPSLKKKSETALIPTTEFEETQPEKTSISTETSESDQSVEENTISYQQETSSYFPKTVEDSTTITAEEAAYMKDEALRAQKLGTWSLITSIVSPVMFVLAVILLALAFGGGAPAAGIASIVLAVATLVSFVLSYVLGFSSLRSQYNTPRGRKFAMAGLIISSVLIGLFLINILVGFF